MRTLFHQILDLFRGSDPLRETLEMFTSMLVDSRWMYEQVLDVYTGKQKASDIEDELFARDRKINATERMIRRRLVEYLSITEQPDVASCLVLMSVAKDAERVGDYIKNMYDICVPLRHESGTDSDLDLEIHQMRSRALPIFDSTRRAFLSSDRDLARHTLKSALALAREAEETVWSVADRTDISPKSAVLYALTARHVKRIVSHLGNISTAILQPVDWMDYTDEPSDTQAEDPPPTPEEKV